MVPLNETSMRYECMCEESQGTIGPLHVVHRTEAVSPAILPCAGVSGHLNGDLLAGNGTDVFNLDSLINVSETLI